MTQPRPASVPPVSSTAGPNDLHRLPPDLIVPAAELFDAPAIRSRIEADIQAGEGRGAVRAAAVAHLKAANVAGRERIAAGFTAHPQAARETVSAYSWLTDRLVETVFDLVVTHLHPRPNPTEGERLAVFAVGGYGRAEMAPYSDVDLLFLSPWKLTGWAESVIESMLYILWDLKLKVGHASRTLKDCVRLGRDDTSIRTALLEHRFLCGEGAIAADLAEALWTELFEGTETDFIRAKLAERSERHEKQGGQRYVVEPNVKEGKGGLRDLQTLFWIAKYVNHVEDVADLVGTGTYSRGEFDGFVRAESFLLAVRCHLHLITGRAMDQLTFDLQVEVAERMGYSDRAGRRAVEVFMQDYFRHATRVGELTRILLTALEADHKKEAPRLAGFFRRRRKLRKGYALKQNRLTCADPDIFLADGVNILRIFDEALRTGYLLHPVAMRTIAANLKRIDDVVRKDPEANRIFLDLLLKHGNPDRALRRMNELGVLSAFIPDFEPIVAMMQFDMYHSYTVDEHTIQCIRNLSEIEAKEHVDDLPVATEIAGGEINRKVLYLALFLHDIGKGREEDHSIVGARIARKLCPRFGLSRADCETVEWLVRYHLLMSDMAQKRDLADPRTVRDFAKAVRTRKRLDLLTVLTVCDIRGVGPGVWNNWKGQLLRTLYRETAYALENGLEAINREHRGNEARRKLREALSDWDRKNLKIETGRHYSPYWQGLTVQSHIAFAHMLRDIRDDQIRIDIEDDADRDATRDLLRDGRPSRHLLAPRGRARDGRRERRRRPHLHVEGRLRDGRVLGAGRGRPPLRSDAHLAAQGHDRQDAEGRGDGATGIGRPRQDQAARTRFPCPDGDRLRQRGVRNLHDRRGRHARPARPAARPDPRPGEQQHLHFLRRDRDLRRAGGRHLLREGHVRPENLHRNRSRRPSSANFGRLSTRGPSERAPERLAAARAADHSCRDPSRGTAMAIVPPRLLTSFVTVGSWTFASRILGFVRDIMIAAFLGAGPVAEAFLVAFALPNMFRRFFAEGAFNMAFVPLFSKKLEGDDGAGIFARDAFSGLASVLLVFTVMAQIAMPALVFAMASGFVEDDRFDLAVLFGRICFPYILFISLAALLSGLLNATGRFMEAAATPLMLNVALIAALSFGDWMGWPAGLTLAWTVPIGGILQLAIVWIAADRAGFRLVPGRPRLTPEMRRLAVVMGPAMLSGESFRSTSSSAGRWRASSTGRSPGSAMPTDSTSFLSASWASRSAWSCCRNYRGACGPPTRSADATS